MSVRSIYKIFAAAQACFTVRGIIFYLCVVSCIGSRAEEKGASASAIELNRELSRAVQSGIPKLVESALAGGANPNAIETNRPSPLIQLLTEAKRPFSESQRQCMTLLLQHGANPNAQDADRRTLLILAARLGDLETVRLLIEAGAYARSRDRFHHTALMYAVEARRRDIVKYLAENGDLQSLPYLDKQALKNAAKKQN